VWSYKTARLLCYKLTASVYVVSLSTWLFNYISYPHLSAQTLAPSFKVTRFYSSQRNKLCLDRLVSMFGIFNKTTFASSTFATAIPPRQSTGACPAGNPTDGLPCDGVLRLSALLTPGAVVAPLVCWLLPFRLSVLGV